MEVFVPLYHSEFGFLVGDVPHPLGVGIVGAGVLIVLPGESELEEIMDGLDGDAFHLFNIFSPGLFIFFRRDYFLPLKAVIGEYRLGIGEGHRLDIPGLDAAAEPELVDPGKIGIQGKRSSSRRDVLSDGQAETVLHVVVFDIDHFPGLIVLE